MTTAIDRLQTALDTLRLKAVEARLESLLEQASKKEAPLRPRPRKRLSEVQGWGNFDRNYGEFSTGIDMKLPSAGSQPIAKAAVALFGGSATGM